MSVAELGLSHSESWDPSYRAGDVQVRYDNSSGHSLETLVTTLSMHKKIGPWRLTPGSFGALALSAVVHVGIIGVAFWAVQDIQPRPRTVSTRRGTSIRYASVPLPQWRREPERKRTAEARPTSPGRLPVHEVPRRMSRTFVEPRLIDDRPRRDLPVTRASSGRAVSRNRHLPPDLVVSPPGAISPASADSIPEPRYPRSCIRHEHQGKVVVLVRISPAGKVLEVTVKENSGCEELDRAATDAVRRGKFQAQVKDGTARESLLEIPFEFKFKYGQR